MSSPTITDANQIVDLEYKRIEQKKNDIDDEYNTQKRLLGFNNSFNERYSYYISMLYVVVVALVIFIALSILGNTFPIPSIIIDILVVLLICGTGAILFSYYSVISSRSNINFSELNLGPPADLSQNSIDLQRVDESQLISDAKTGCMNGDCCNPPTTSWCKSSGKCVPGVEGDSAWDSNCKAPVTTSAAPVSGFTTMEIIENFTALPNSAYEFSSYSNY
jgi:hypothetical protein